MAPMMHPRHLYFMGRGIYSGVEGAGTNMSENGRLIVCTIIGWKITTLEIKGGARAP